MADTDLSENTYIPETEPDTNKKVAVIGGDGFGFPDYVRISYTLNEETLTEAATRIEDFIAKKAKD